MVLMIEKALSDSESALLFGNTNKVFASFERTPNLFVAEKMSSSFPIFPQKHFDICRNGCPDSNNNIPSR
jgi:hypothetical protein